jgi:hypothetical protein
VSRSGAARGDIALVNPVPDRAANVTTPEVRQIAPLFAGGSAANTTTVRGEAAGSLAGIARSGGRSFDLVSSDRRNSASGYRDFAGERSRRGSNSSNGSGGSSVGGGGIGGGGGAWGGASGTASTKGPNSASTSGSARAANAPRQSSGSARGAAGTASAPGLAVAVATPAAINTPVIGGLATGPLGDSPGPSPTPEPLTLLLVGSGLAGLYGVRKHIAG